MKKVFVTDSKHIISIFVSIFAESDIKWVLKVAKCWGYFQDDKLAYKLCFLSLL